MVWVKKRIAAASHGLYDTNRGANQLLITDNTNAQATYSGVSSFAAAGFNLGSGNEFNQNGQTFASWTFRKQPKFFDVVTYTGNGALPNQLISHSLGAVPGCIIIKATSAERNWIVWHRGNETTNYTALSLNLTAASGGSVGSGDLPTATQFKPGAFFDPDYNNGNETGVTYVAYLFAHNAGGFGLTGTDNVISCGSFTTDGSGFFTATLGYEPQWVMYKQTNAADDWKIIDTMRGMTNPYTNGARLLANSSAAEGTGNGFIEPTATGFYGPGTGAAGGAYIYIAIRRGPMKVPTDATKVFAPVTRTGTGSATTQTAGFPVDLFIPKTRNGGTAFTWSDRLRGDVFVQSANAQAENYPAYTTFDNQTGVNLTSYFYPNNAASEPYVKYNFRRAPSYFDEVCYTGTGSAHAETHNLTVPPELVLIKSRNTAGTNWSTYFDFTTTTYKYVAEQTGNAASSRTYGPGGSPNFEELSAAPTATAINLASSAESNANGRTFVAYLFASCPGVSKVGSYTGNGSSQTINCGFTGGARFVLIKRTDSTGDWYVWDSARGLSSSTDPYLLLNSTAAEVTSTNWVDTTSTGFQVTAASGNNVNISGASYIALAIA